MGNRFCLHFDFVGVFVDVLFVARNIRSCSLSSWSLTSCFLGEITIFAAGSRSVSIEYQFVVRSGPSVDYALFSL